MYTTGEVKFEHISVGAAQGWQCPICRKVLAPWVQECLCCVEDTTKVYADGALIYEKKKE